MPPCLFRSFAIPHTARTHSVVHPPSAHLHSITHAMQTSSTNPAGSSGLPPRPLKRPWRNQLFFAVIESQRKTLGNHRREPERKVFAMYLPPQLCSGMHPHGKIDTYHVLNRDESAMFPVGTQMLLRLDYRPGQSRFVQRCTRYQALLVIAVSTVITRACDVQY